MERRVSAWTVGENHGLVKGKERQGEQGHVQDGMGKAWDSDRQVSDWRGKQRMGSAWSSLRTPVRPRLEGAKRFGREGAMGVMEDDLNQINALQETVYETMRQRDASRRRVEELEAEVLVILAGRAEKGTALCDHRRSIKVWVDELFQNAPNEDSHFPIHKARPWLENALTRCAAAAVDVETNTMRQVMENVLSDLNFYVKHQSDIPLPKTTYQLWQSTMMAVLRPELNNAEEEE